MADNDARPRERASEHMLGVLDTSPVPTGISRLADGVIVFVNPAFVELLGWQDSGFVGKTMVEAGFWSQPERRAAALAQLVDEGAVCDLEEEIRTSSGEAKVVLVSISHLELDGVPCLIGHIRDITERRRLETQLRESEERFRQITETVEQAFLLRSIDPPAVLYASPGVAPIFGVDLDTVYADPGALQALIHPDDRDDVIGRRDAMTGPADFEFRIVRPDGETRWIRTRAEPVETQAGRSPRIAAVSEDVTEAHALREALRASEERFRLLAENSTDVIGRLSLDMRIDYISPACRSVYGYEPAAMVGRFGWEFVYPDDLVALREDFSARDDQTGVITNTYRVQRGDGTLVWVEAKIRALRDAVSGEPIEFHTVARDVSDRKRAEADVRRAKEEAELANSAKSEFLSRMSHELRTPLHAILGFGELLEREALRPAQHDQVAQITRGGRHLLELINEVLDLSRIERGELRLSLEPVDVGRVVEETLGMVAPLAASRLVTVTTPSFDEPHLHVLADWQRLKQVLLNLLSNAVKYNRTGGDIRIAIAGSSGSATARIEVSDTGIGIAAGDIARVFAPFDRLGAETTDVEGTGLGLALAKRLIEAMDGEIGVESEVGRGTTFWISLPVVAAHDVPPAPAHDEPPAQAARATIARTVLYIEDNPSNIHLVEAILAARPEVALLVATQGGLGLELAREHRPALILLDLNLPDMSGEEVLRRLRSDARSAETGIVMLSADATSGQIARLRSAGADDYLTKPFEIDRFLAVIDSFTTSPTDDGDEHPAGPEPDTAPAGEPLDLARLENLRSAYPAGQPLQEFIDLFRRESTTHLEALAAAAAAADAEAVRQAAHAWRGAASIAGAQLLAAQLADIEALARVGSVPDEGVIAAVSASYREAATALARALAGEAV
jgi:PAS domain S-box-containing protein